MVAGLFERGILAVGLTFPVVPKGDETIRFQINAAHTEGDIDELLGALKELKGSACVPFESPRLVRRSSQRQQEPE